jgi:hypothetical protein
MTTMTEATPHTLGVRGAVLSWLQPRSCRPRRGASAPDTVVFTSRRISRTAIGVSVVCHAGNQTLSNA